MPRVLIIQATGYRFRNQRIPYRIRKRKLVGGVLPYLAALVPREWNVKVHDDAVRDVDFDAPVDVVVLGGVRTVTSLRSYEIAAKFKERNVPVLMGGPHMTFYSEEAAQHVDAVCVGEGEEMLPRMLEDAAAGRLKKIYRRETPADLSCLPTPRWDLLNPHDYVFYRPFVVLHSRGCPFTCDFCAEYRLLGDWGYRVRPAEQVVEDIKKCGSKHIFFAASQFAGNTARTMELMEALIPLKIRWSTLFSSHYCLDPKFLDLAQRSGLLHVNTGIESIDQQTLKSMHKGFNRVREYERLIAEFHKRNISYSLNFVFGSDEEQEDAFDTTLEWLCRNKAHTAYFNILVPLRGTPLYERMKADGRIIDEENMERWTGVFCNYRPLRYSPEELVYRVKKIRRDFYAWRSTLRRLPFPTSQADFASWNLNILQRKVSSHLDSMRDFSEF